MLTESLTESKQTDKQPRDAELAVQRDWHKHQWLPLHVASTTTHGLTQHARTVCIQQMTRRLHATLHDSRCTQADQ